MSCINKPRKLHKRVDEVLELVFNVTAVLYELVPGI